MGDPGLVALALGTAHLAAHLLIVPFGCLLPDHPSIASTGERLLVWTLLTVATPLVFWSERLPSLPFLLIPLLAWGALRVRALEALGQLVLVLGITIALTTLDHGPFASVPQALGLTGDTRGVLLAAFAATCGLIVLPLTLRVGEQVATAREARAERNRLRNIVDGTPGVAIIGTDPQGRITLFNPGAERLLGYSREEMLGRPTRRLHRDATITEQAARPRRRRRLRRRGAATGDPRRRARPRSGFVRKDGVERQPLDDAQPDHRRPRRDRSAT